MQGCTTNKAACGIETITANHVLIKRDAAPPTKPRAYIDSYVEAFAQKLQHDL